VLRQLKANPHTAGIPVLVVSAAGADQSIRGQLFELGAEEVLAKPIDLSATFATVERLAARGRSPAGT
jgi:CheY-like chemotaxis protein